MRPLPPRPHEHLKSSANGKRDAVVLAEADRGERERAAQAGLGARRILEVRALRNVAQQIERQVLEFFEQPQEHAPQAPVHVPIDAAQIVAGRVRAVVLELDAAALVARALLGEQTARRDALGDDAQVLERREKTRVAQLGGGNALQRHFGSDASRGDFSEHFAHDARRRRSECARKLSITRWRSTAGDLGDVLLATAKRPASKALTLASSNNACSRGDEPSATMSLTSLGAYSERGCRHHQAQPRNSARSPAQAPSARCRASR
jgi:hypothetical protein